MINNPLHGFERRFLLKDSSKIRNFSCKSSNNLALQILEKFANSSKLLINFLRPSIYRLSKEDYSCSQPHFTIKSNPAYIVKTGN
jgi:hypothetical protein